MLKSIMVLTRQPRSEGDAFARAALLAERHAARLRVVQLQTERDGSSARTADNRNAGDVRAIRTTRDRLLQEGPKSDLVVVAGPPGRALPAGRGEFLSWILQHCPAPLLFVRRPVHGSYEHVLAAVDFKPVSLDVVRAAASLHPEARLELFHAFDTVVDPDGHLHPRAAHPGAMHARECMPEVRQRSVIYTDSFDSRRNRVMAMLGRGDLARHAANQQEHSGADVVVIGRERPEGLKDFLLGVPAQRLLKWTQADVMVVPTGQPPVPHHTPRRGGNAASGLSGASLLLPEYWHTRSG